MHIFAQLSHHEPVSGSYDQTLTSLVVSWKRAMQLQRTRQIGKLTYDDAVPSSGISNTPINCSVGGTRDGAG
jgi:hypothetical protein